VSESDEGIARASGESGHEVVGFVIDSDERVGGGGFLEIRRVRMRNRRADGSISPQYVCDSIARPYGQDAVVVCVFASTSRVDGGIDGRVDSGIDGRVDSGIDGRVDSGIDGRVDGGIDGRVDDGIDGVARSGVRVLVREGLRPPLVLARDASIAPLPEPPPTMFVTELVAGIVETTDRGEAGLRERAAAEVLEEAGFVVDPARVIVLGAGSLPSPGAMIEKFYFCAVEVDPRAQQPLAGDGSPMEEGARTRWLDLDDAIDACVRGEICDLKTELGLRRLQEHLRA
jgi:8-oxo-dGTP pyrophosphatase MutT (NUDIX family)